MTIRAIADVNNTSVHSYALGAHGYDETIIQRATDFLDLPDIGRCMSVCRLWNKACNNSEVWAGLFNREGIPGVKGHDPSMFKMDFKVLSPICISAARISRFFGEIVGSLPCISEKCFNKLNDRDPFRTGRLKKDTFMFVVVLNLIRRIAGPESPFDFDEYGNLIELPANQVENGKELMISFSVRNMEVLCKHPLDGKENLPVFEECSFCFMFPLCPNKVKVYFMRCSIAEESRGMTYPQQENFVRERGFEVASLLPRALFNVMAILFSGKCQDAIEGDWWPVRLGTFSRCSDPIPCAGGKISNDKKAIIGEYDPRYGLALTLDNYGGVDKKEIAVVPCVDAEI